MRRILACLASILFQVTSPAQIPTDAAFHFKCPIEGVRGGSLIGYAVTGSPSAQKVYLLGGISNIAFPDGGPGTETAIRVYDIPSNSWITLPGQLPYPWFSSFNNDAALASNGKIYLGPGNGPWGWGQHHRIIEIDPTTGVSTERASLTGGSSIWGMAVTPAPQGGVFLFGGWNGGGVSEIRHYDPLTDTVSIVGHLTSGREVSARQVLPDGRIILFGGNGYDTGTLIEAYDPATHAVTVISNPNQFSMMHLISCWLGADGKVYVHQSSGNGPATSEPRSVLKFDPGLNVLSDTGIIPAGPGTYFGIYGDPSMPKVFGFSYYPWGPFSWPQNLPAETWQLDLPGQNRPPILASIPNSVIREGQLLQFVVSALDPDGNGVVLSAANLPSGAVFDPSTGSFSWTPRFDQAGNHLLTLTARDDGTPPALASQTVTITVDNVNRPPLLAPIGNRQVQESATLQFTLMASDPDGDAMTFSASNLPSGATFDAATGTFTWAPAFDQAGNYPDVEFSVSDHGSPMELATELITITVANVNRTPIFIPLGTQQVQEGSLLQFIVQAEDPDGDRLAYQASNLPPGAMFDPATRTFTWTPGMAQAGQHVVGFTATDDGQPALAGTLGIPIVVGDVPTPCELASQLVSAVVDLHLSKPTEASYLANLKKVCGFIEEGKIIPAVNQVDAFIRKVETDVRAGLLPAGVGESLTSQAQALLNSIGH